VKVYLPRVEAEEPAAPGWAAGLQGHETVLVAEDEDGVRELLRKVLAEHGHRVLEARHGRDALLVAERYEGPVDLLITDVVMPELGGSELAERLSARHPGLKVLYISGYTNDEVVRRGVSRTAVHFLQKPFSSQELMRKVREVLDAGRCPPRVRLSGRGLHGAEHLGPDVAVQVQENLPHGPVRLGRGRGRGAMARPDALLVLEDEPALGILIDHAHHRPGAVGPGRGPPLGQSHEERAHALDDVDRAAELAGGLVETDPHVGFRPLFQGPLRRRGGGRRRDRRGHHRRGRRPLLANRFLPAAGAVERRGGGGAAARRSRSSSRVRGRLRADVGVV
jgi:CheY-like chemotaxis protein